MALTCFGSRMSAAMSKASPPAALIMPRVSLASRSGLRLTPTSAPSDASRTAVAWPIPVVAPVTSATFPTKRRSIGASLSFLWSEHADRVPRATRGARQAQRQAYDHELPALLLLASVGDLLQVEAVGDQHAHGGELQSVDGIGHLFDVARHGLAVAVREERRDAPLMHPGHGVDMQPCLAFPGRRIVVAPGAERAPAGVMACPEDEDIALAQTHALRLLDGLQFGARHGLAGLEPVDLAVARRVEQHAAADDAAVIGRDASPVRPARGEQRGRLAVVELALVGDVIQRIDMGMAVAVAGHAEIAHAEGKPALADGDIVHQRHEVHGRVRIIGAGLLVDG